GPAARRQVLRHVDALAPQPQSNGARAQSEHSLQPLGGVSRLLNLARLLEREHACVELRGAVHVGYRHPDATDAANERLGASARAVRDDRRCRDEDGPADLVHGVPQASRSRRCSATRSAFAMMVSPGFTAPEEGKKLASTTYRLSTSCALQL